MRISSAPRVSLKVTFVTAQAFGAVSGEKALNLQTYPTHTNEIKTFSMYLNRKFQAGSLSQLEIT